MSDNADWNPKARSPIDLDQFKQRYQLTPKIHIDGRVDCSGCWRNEAYSYGIFAVLHLEAVVSISTKNLDGEFAKQAMNSAADEIRRDIFAGVIEQLGEIAFDTSDERTRTYIEVLIGDMLGGRV